MPIFGDEPDSPQDSSSTNDSPSVAANGESFSGARDGTLDAEDAAVEPSTSRRGTIPDLIESTLGTPQPGTHVSVNSDGLSLVSTPEQPPTYDEAISRDSSLSPENWI